MKNKVFQVNTMTIFLSASLLILSLAGGDPVRTIASIYRGNPLVTISNTDPGITRPEDIIGKTVRLTTDMLPVFHAMMARVGSNPESYSEVDIPSINGLRISILKQKAPNWHWHAQPNCASWYWRAGCREDWC